MALCSSIYAISDYIHRLYTDATLVLDASTRVAEVAGSGLVDVHVCVASSTMHGLHVSHQQCSCLVLRRKLTLRASRRSVALSRSIHRCSAHARRVCACSRGRRKRLGSGLVDGHVRVASSTMLGLQVASMLPPHGYGNAFQAAVQTQHIGYNASDSDVSSVTPPADGNAGGAADGSAGGAVGSATRLLLANGRDGAAAPLPPPKIKEVNRF